jgi:hypothetical protein
MSGPVASPFPEEALDENRRGRLTDAQRRSWTGVDRRWGGTVSLMALVLAVAGAGLLTDLGRPTLPTPVRLMAGVGCLVAAGVLVCVSLLGGGQLTRDLRQGRVDSTEGAVSKERDPMPTYAGPNPRRRYLEVGGRRLECDQGKFDAAPDAGIVRVYYLPRSRRVVNLERLADGPLPAGALENPMAIVAQAVHGVASTDRTQRAEAMATLAALQDAVAGQATPPTAGGDARPLGEAIVGAWRGPVMNVTFDADGNATGAMANGMRMAGRWSVGADGKLRLDVLGQDMVTDAWVAGDVLTVVMDSMPMSFRRAGGA